MQPSFVKRINQSMSKIDPLLKTLQVRPSPPEALVQAYLIHIADKSDTNFRKILDLKGIRKAEQTQLLDLFSAFRASPNHENLAQNSSFLTPLQIQAGQSSSGIGSLGNAGSVMGTPSLGGGRFDPAGLGNMLVNAARDGVDRFGTPGPEQKQQGSGGADGGANLESNLKNIGKFFRRDVGGFRGFGRSEDGR
jgi:hypothetical protein